MGVYVIMYNVCVLVRMYVCVNYFYCCMHMQMENSGVVHMLKTSKVEG